jgi:hypothetical protein
MALTFPANPTNGQIYEQYVYDATAQSWRVYGSDTGITNVLATKANLSGGNTFSGNQIFNNFKLNPNQPMFSVGNESGPTTTATNKITFNQVQANVQNYWSTANHRFTAPIAGYYFFSHSVLNNTAAAMNVAYYKNGSTLSLGQYPRGYANSVQYIANTASGFIYLAQNDYIELWCVGGVTHTNHVNFTGFLVG